MQYQRQGETTNTLRGIGLASPQSVAPVLNFLNASIGADIGTWNVELFGRNLLNEDEKIRPALTGFAAQARPRTIGVKVGMDF